MSERRGWKPEVEVEDITVYPPIEVFDPEYTLLEHHINELRKLRPRVPDHE